MMKLFQFGQKKIPLEILGVESETIAKNSRRFHGNCKNKIETKRRHKGLFASIEATNT